jgi:hypothetical protein
MLLRGPGFYDREFPQAFTHLALIEAVSAMRR